MAKIECNDCGEMIEVTANSVSLPYVCGNCMEDFEAEDISMEQVLGIDPIEIDPIEDENLGQKYEDMAPTSPCPCTSCTYIRGVLGHSAPSLLKIADNEGVQQALAARGEKIDLSVVADVTEQLIADLKAQNESITREIEFADARARKYQIIAKNEEALRVSAEARLEALEKWASGSGLTATKAALEQSQKEVLEYQESVDELREALSTVKGERDRADKALGIIARAVGAVSLSENS